MKNLRVLDSRNVSAIMAAIFILAVFSIGMLSQSAAALGGRNGLNHPVLNFKQWKDREIINADNRISRLNNEIANLREAHKGDYSDVTKLARQLQTAVAAASVVQKLSIEDYINVYVSQLRPAPAVLQKIAKSLSQRQVADLLVSYFKSRNRAQAGTTSVQLASY